MKKFSKVALSTLAVCGAWLLAIYSCNAATDAQTAQLQLIVEEGTLTIGIEQENLSLGSVHSSFSDQTTTGNFTTYMWIEDLKWAATGYYTTVEASNLTWIVEGTEYTIDSANIKFTANEKETITWASNDKVYAYWENAALNTAVTYFQRWDWSTPTTGGILGRYGTKPSVSVMVPANTPATTYTGILTYTLFDRDVSA